MHVYLQFSLFRELHFFSVEFCFFQRMKCMKTWCDRTTEPRKIRARSHMDSYSVLECVLFIILFLAIPGEEIFAGMVEAWKGNYPLMVASC